MTIMRTIKDDVDSLAMHVLDVADYASGIAAQAKDDLTTELDKAKAEIEKAFDDKLAAFKSEIMGDVDAEKSKAVVQLGDKVATLGKVSDTSTTALAAAPAAEAPAADASAQTAPVAPVVTQTASGALATVDTAAGTTTHEAGDGTVTVVPHDGSEPVATDAAGQVTTPTPEAVAEAVAASADAGVTVPAAAPSAV